MLAASALAAPAFADGTAAPADTPVSSIGKQLASVGIILNADYFGEFASNPSGGARQGSEYTDQISWGFDADLQKLANIEGGSLHVQWSNRDGNNLASSTINNSVSVQQLYGGGQTNYLSTLTYEQKLFGDVLDIQGGRTEVGQIAFQDPIYCDFQSNGICGNPPIMGQDTTSSFYPVPVWGGWAKVTPAKDFYAQAGLFDNDPTTEESPHSGYDFSFAHSSGALIPVEAGYQTSFADDPYPRRFDVGAIFDQTPYSFTTFEPSTGTLGSTEARDRQIVYLQAKQMVFRPDMNAERGLTAFGAVALGPDSNQPDDYSITAGAVYQGIIPSRDKDTLGVIVNDTHFRSQFTNQLYAFRVNELGGSQRPASNEIMAEINYDYFVTPWADVMPNLQYIVNPDGLGGDLPYPRSNINDTFVVGVQVHINLAGLVGLPTSSM